MESRTSRLAKHLCFLGAALLAGGLGGATLVRYAPGFSSDERLLDPSLGVETRQAIEAERAAESDVAAFYLRFLGGLVRGDLGESRMFARPVSELIGERAAVTGQLVLWGLAGGWAAALFSACLAGLARGGKAGWIMSAAPSAASSILVTVPAALLAFACLWSRMPVAWAMAAAVFPKVYRYSSNLIADGWDRPHVLGALARGIGSRRVFLAHVLRPLFPQLCALAGVSFATALGASVPVEVLADVPGIGQLAWQAAAGRDLPLIVALTLVVTAATLTANAMADLARSGDEA